MIVIIEGNVATLQEIAEVGGERQIHTGTTTDKARVTNNSRIRDRQSE